MSSRNGLTTSRSPRLPVFPALLLLLCLVLLPQASAQTRSVTLAWDASTDTTVTGHYLYYWSLPNGLVTKVPAQGTTHTLSNLTTGLTYAFFITATNAVGLESEPSNTVHFTPLTTLEDTPLTNLLQTLTTDLTRFTITDIQNGQVTPTNGPPPLSFLPTTNFFGNASFTYLLQNDFSEPIQGWVSINVEDVEDIPPPIPAEFPADYKLPVSPNQPFAISIQPTNLDPASIEPGRLITHLGDDGIYPESGDYYLTDYGMLTVHPNSYEPNQPLWLVYEPDPKTDLSQLLIDTFEVITYDNDNPFTPPQITTVSISIPPQITTRLTADINWTEQVTMPAPALLSAEVADAAGVPIADAQLLWKVTAAPPNVPLNMVAFSSTNTPITQATLPAPGSYTLELTATYDGITVVATQLVESVELQTTKLVSIGLEAEQTELTDGILADTELTPSGESVTFIEFTNPTALLNLDFEITTPGDYIVWGRVKTRTEGSDSFFVSMDDGPIDVYDCAAERYSDEYHWTPLSGRAGNLDSWEASAYAENARIFHLEPGPHTLSFSLRESGARLDSVLIVNASSVNPFNATAPLSPRTRMIRNDEGPQLLFEAIAGLRYRVEYTPYFGYAWRTVVATTPKQSSLISVDLSYTRGFYRVLFLE